MTQKKKKYILRIDPKRCKACELCIDACPKKIMILSDTINELGFRVAACMDETQCSGCLACAQVCPDVAIEIDKESET
ncbi:4Fe-4S dicluster domain-containing protein [candidate division FCPU426 bacterium]|nr:4Fe-4S dicluster domain-containing protein [candidate division FCPU426 bacterium]